MAELVPPRRDEALTADGIPSLRFSEYLEGLARNVNSVTTEVDVSTASFSDISLQGALIARLSRRIDDLEASDDTEVFNSRIAQISAKVTRLIEELIEAVNNLSTVEIDNIAVANQEQTIKQLKLLNIRVEEAFVTKLTEEDIE